MAKKSIEQELQEATGVKPKAKEKRHDYLKRLHGAVAELDDEGWKGLSTPAQKWANEATKAFDADKDIPDFADAEEAAPAKPGKGKQAATEEEGEDEAEDEAEAEAEAEADEDETSADEPEGEGEKEDTNTMAKAKKPAAGKKADTKKPAKAPAKADKAPAKKSKSSGGVQAVMAHVLKNPDDKVEDIIAALKKDGMTLTPSTVSSARGFFKLVVRFLQDRKLTTKKLFD